MEKIRGLTIHRQYDFLFSQFCLRNNLADDDDKNIQKFLNNPIHIIAELKIPDEKPVKRQEFERLLQIKRYKLKDDKKSKVGWFSGIIKFKELENLVKIPQISNIYWDPPLYLCQFQNNPEKNAQHLKKSHSPLSREILPFLTERKVKIAVFDTGVISKDILEQFKVVHKKNITDEPPEDLNGHGTIMAQLLTKKIKIPKEKDTIIESGTFSRPRIEIQSFKLFDRDGMARLSDLMYLLDELYQDSTTLTISDRVQLLLIPASTGPLEGYSEILEPLFSRLGSLGIIPVCAAGNFGPELNSTGYPAGLSSVLTVGALDSQAREAFYSSRNISVREDSSKHIKPDLYDIGKFDKFRDFSGSSVASAKVCAKLAIIKALHPDLKLKSLKDLIHKTINKEKISGFNMVKILKELGWWLEVDRNIDRMVLNAAGFAGLLFAMFFIAFFLI